MEAVHRILRYLERTLGKGLLFKKGQHLRVEAYIDTEWTRAVKDRTSTFSFYTMVGESLVIWRSKKQSAVA